MTFIMDHNNLGHVQRGILHHFTL